MLGTAVLLDGGNSSIITSDFSSQNPIRISNNTEAHLTGNHAEDTGSDSWSVYNDGELNIAERKDNPTDVAPSYYLNQEIIIQQRDN